MKTLPKELKARHKQFVAEIAEARKAVEDAVQAYNDKLDEAEEWCTDEVAVAIDEYMSDRTEKWQESESGELITNWKDAFESADFTRMDEPDFDGEDEFAALPLDRDQV